MEASWKVLLVILRSCRQNHDRKQTDKSKLIAYFFNRDHSFHSACVTVWTGQRMFEAQPYSSCWLLTVTVHQGRCCTLQSRNPHSPPASSNDCFKTQYLQPPWMSLETLERNLCDWSFEYAELGYKMLQDTLPSLTCCTCSELMTPSVQVHHQVAQLSWRWMHWTLQTSELFSGWPYQQSAVCHRGSGARQNWPHKAESAISVTQAREDVSSCSMCCGLITLIAI